MRAISGPRGENNVANRGKWVSLGDVGTPYEPHLILQTSSCVLIITR
jgi:hypothetical protein